MAQSFNSRSLRRIKRAVQKTEATARRAAANVSPAGQVIEGLLTGSLGPASSLGAKATASMQVWKRDPVSDVMSKATDTEGEDVIVTVVNRIPLESYEAGIFATCINVYGEWRIIGASCDAFPDEI